jgi:hypothetical protein
MTPGEKSGLARKGKPLSPGHCAALSDAKRGRTHSDAHRAAIAAGVGSGESHARRKMRRQIEARLTPRQRAEFCALVDDHGYTFSDALNVARLIGSTPPFTCRPKGTRR